METTINIMESITTEAMVINIINSHLEVSQLVVSRSQGTITISSWVSPTLLLREETTTGDTQVKMKEQTATEALGRSRTSLVAAIMDQILLTTRTSLSHI